MEKQKIDDNVVIIGDKSDEVYIARIARMFNRYNHMIIQSPVGKESRANMIAQTFNFCSDESIQRRKYIKVSIEKKGEKFKFDALKIQLDLYPALKVRRE